MSPSAAAEERTNGTEIVPVHNNLLSESIAETEKRVVLEAKQFEHKQRLAGLFAKSGCFSDIKKNISEQQALAQAFVKIELGESMGFTPAESMQGVSLIQGVPSVNAQLRAARMQRAGFHWDIDWFDNSEGVCEGCRLWLYRHGKALTKILRHPDGSPVVGEDGRPLMEHVSVAFLKKDAEMLKTKIWEGDSSRTASVLEKDNWKGSPRNMYFARAITNAQRFHAAGVLSGEIPSTEEAMDFVDPDEEYKHGSFEAQQQVLREKLAAAERWRSASANEVPPSSAALAPDSTPASGNGDHAATPSVPGEPQHAGSVPTSPVNDQHSSESRPVFGRKSR